MPRSTRLLVSTALVLGCLGLAAPAAEAAADDPIPLGISGFGDILVDQAHGRVFISDGTNQVLVRGLDGSAITSIGGLAKPQGMTLSDDGGTLYVAVADARILVVDPVTLATSSLAMPGACPVDVATTSGLLWVANNCATRGSIDALDPTTGIVTPGLVTNAYEPQVTASPAAPDRLFWFEAGLSPGTVRLGRTIGGATPTMTQAGAQQVGSNTRGLAVSPDGTRVVVASGSPYVHPAYSTNDLAPLGSYPTTSYPNAVAFRHDGLLAAGTTNALFLFAPGTTTAPVQRTFSGSESSLATNGLAFGATSLYAVVEQDVYGDTFGLEIKDPAGLDAPRIYVAPNRLHTPAYGYDDKISVTVTPAPSSAERQVRIYATPVRGERRLLDSGVLAAGKSSYTAKVLPRENVEITAEVTQAGLVSSPSAPVAVKVRAKITQRALKRVGRSGAYSLYRVGTKAYIKGTVRPGHAGQRKVYWRVQYLARGGIWKGGKTKRARLSRDSSAYVFFGGQAYLRGARLRVSMVWLGDRRNPRTEGPWTYVMYR